MAYLQAKEDTQDEEAKKKQPGTSEGGAAGDVSAGTAAPATNSASAPGKSADSSGQFVNLSRYLSANTGQTEKLADQVAGKVSQYGTDATNALQSAKDQIGQQVAAGTVNLDQNLLDQAIADPTKADVTALGKLTGGVYSGPQDAQSTGLLSDVDTAMLKAKEAADLTKTAGGQKELIQQTTGKPTTAGSLSLDQYLLQNVQPANAKLASAADALKPLGDQYTAAQTQLGKDIDAAKQTTANTATAAKGQLAQAATGIQQQVQDEVARQRAEAQLALDNARVYLNAHPVTADRLPPGLLDQLGLTSEQWNQLAAQNAQLQANGGQGINLGNYLQAGDPTANITANNVATADQAARYAALSSLAGAPGGFINPSSLSQRPDILNLDTASASQALANDAANQQAIAQQQAAAQQQANAIQAQANQQRKAQNTNTAISVASTIATIAIAVFCYGEGTRILLADGTYCNVEDLELGMETFMGGPVIGYGVALAPEVYYYKGCVVTGLHPVFEDGVWLKVKDSKLAQLLESSEPVAVYPVGTQDHLLVTDSHVSTDVYELDDYDKYTGDERIALLNGQAERNLQIRDLEQKLREEESRKARNSRHLSSPKGGH